MVESSSTYLALPDCTICFSENVLLKCFELHSSPLRLLHVFHPYSNSGHTSTLYMPSFPDFVVRKILQSHSYLSFVVAFGDVYFRLLLRPQVALLGLGVLGLLDLSSFCFGFVANNAPNHVLIEGCRPLEP